MPSIADIRARFPGTKDQTDLQIAQVYADRTGESLDTIAYELGVALPKIGGNSGAAWESGKAGYKQGFGHIGAAIGESTGWEGLKNAGARLRDDQGIIQNYADSKNTDPTSFKDVHGLGDLGGYVRSGAIKSLPYMAEAIGFAAADGLSGGALTPEILQIYSERVAAKYAAESISKKAATSGASNLETQAAAKAAATTSVGRGLARSTMIPVVTAPSSLGDVLGNQYAESGKYDLGGAALPAMGYAALNAFGLEGSIARGLPISLLEKRGLRAGAEFGKSAASESAQEVGQEVMNQAGRMAVNPDATLTSGDSLERYKESAILGGLLGGIPGGAHGALSGSPKAKQAAEDAATAQRLSDNQDVDLLAANNYDRGRYPAQPNHVRATIDEATVEGANLPLNEVVDLNHNVDAKKPSRKDAQAAYTAQLDSPVVLQDENGNAFSTTDAYHQYLHDNGVPIQSHPKLNYVNTEAKNAGTKNYLGMGSPVEQSSGAMPLTGSTDKTGLGLFLGSSSEAAAAPVAAKVNAAPAEVIADAPHIAQAKEELGKAGIVPTADKVSLVSRAINAGVTGDGLVEVVNELSSPKSLNKRLTLLENSLGIVPSSSKLNIEAITRKLSPQEKTVFDVMTQRAMTGDLADIIAADGTIQYQKIADIAGLKGRSGAETSVKRMIAKLNKQAGFDIKEYLAANTKSVRRQEGHAEDNIGLSPELQSNEVDAADLYGNDEGAVAGMGNIKSIGATDTDQYSVTSNNNKKQDAVQAEATKILEDANLLNRGTVQVEQTQDPVNEARAQAAKEKREAAIDQALALPQAQIAAEEWDRLNNNDYPTSKDLTRMDAFEWMMSIEELDHGDITKEDFEYDRTTIISKYGSSAQERISSGGGAIETQSTGQGADTETTGQDTEPTLTGSASAEQQASDVGTETTEVKAEPIVEPAVESVKAEPVVTRKKKTVVVGTKAQGFTAEQTDNLLTGKQDVKAEEPAIAKEEVDSSDDVKQQVREAVEDVLTDADIARVDEHYGTEDNNAAVDAFTEEFTDWVFAGAKDIKHALADLFDKIWQSMKTGSMAFMMLVNLNPSVPHINVSVPVSTYTVNQTVDKPKADFKDITVPASVQMVANWQFNSHKGVPVIIVDKEAGLTYVLDSKGVIAGKTASLTGKMKGDVKSEHSKNVKLDKMSTADKVTEAGEFASTREANSHYGSVIRVVSYANYFTAVHPTYEGSRLEFRDLRLDTPTGADNRISSSCINIPQEFFSGVVAKVVPVSGKVQVVVMPESMDVEAFFPNADFSNTEVVQKTVTIEGSVNDTAGKERISGGNEAIKQDADGKISNRLFSRNDTRKGTTSSAIRAVLKDLTGSATNWKVTIFDTVADAVAHKLVGNTVSSGDQAWVESDDNGNTHAYFVASNIPAGAELAVFLHEVGSHMGIDKILTKAQLKTLELKIEDWAALNDGSVESEIAIAALARVKAAGTEARHIQTETIAYFVEEAVKYGVDPTALEYKSDLSRWFRTLWGAFKIALRRLGINSDKLNAQNVVDLAYGAARLEMNGKWQGGKANFNKHSNAHRGTGEGGRKEGAKHFTDMIAYGQYFADKIKIAKGYRENALAFQGIPTFSYDGAPISKAQIDYKVAPTRDEMRMEMLHEMTRLLNGVNDPMQRVEAHIARNIKGTKEYLKDVAANGSIFVNPEDAKKDLVRKKEELAALESIDISKIEFLNKGHGGLYNTDMNIAPDEYLQWDRTLAEQSPLVTKALEKVKAALEEAGLLDDYLDAKNADWDELYASELYKQILTKAHGDGLNELNDHDEIHVEKAISDYLDKVGIKGVRYEDNSSRGNWAKNKAESDKSTYNYVIFNPKNTVIGAKDTGTQDRNKRFSRLSVAAKRVGGRSGEMVVQEGNAALKKAVYSIGFLHDLVDEFKGRIPAIKKWYEAVQSSIATRRQLEADAETIASAANDLKGGTANVNSFISKSTFEQKWGYDPKIAGRSVVVDPVMAKAFNALTEQEKKVVRDVFAHSEKMRVMKDSILKELGLQPFTSNGRLEGPYAPLKRFGNFVSVLKSTALRNAELAKDDKLVAKLKESSDHYVVSNFDSISQAKQFAKANEKANGGKFDWSDAFEKSERVGEARVLPQNVLQKVLSAVKVDRAVLESMPKVAHEALTKMVTDMYFQSLDEHNARTSGLKRLNRAGYDQDMIRSFLSHARSEAGFLANMKHGGDINTEFYNMQEGAKDQTSGKRIAQDEFNLIASHYAENLKYDETPWQDRAMALTSAWQLATSVGYHITNAMQGIMVTIPKLGSDFNNYSGAWKHLMNGYSVLKDTGMWGNIDLNKIKDANLRAALQKAADMGVLDVGMDEDLTHFEATRTGIDSIDKTTAVARGALHRLRQVSRAVETANRVSSAVAGYNMSIEAGKTVAEAQEYAVRILQTTQGDFSRVGSPLILKRLPKVMTQYKKYQLMMAALYAKAYRDAFHGADAETRAIGKRMLAYKLLHTAAAAGVLGMPLANLVGMVFAAMGDDDEPQDLERSLRELIGDETLSNMLLHGPLAAVGLDMSSKLGDDKIFSILPYGTWDGSSASGLAKTAFSLVGPAASQAGKFADGVGALAKGDYERGLEKFMPKGVESGMKAFRIANEGFSMKNGDIMFKPEDVNAFSLILDGLGMPSSEMKRMEWLKGQQYEINKFYTDRTSSIEHAYNTAYKDEDAEEMAALREDWANLQGGKDDLRQYFGDSNKALKKQPLSNLLKYPHTAAKRERELQRQSQSEH